MRCLLYETRTGAPIMELQRSAWSYDTGILAPDRLEVTIPAYTSWARSLDLHGLLARGKHSVALVDDSVDGVRTVAAAGPIVTAAPREDPDGRHAFVVACRGIERLLEYRHVRLFPGWPLLDGENRPTGTYDQSFEDLEYGTIMKRLVSESEKWAGGDLPVDYEDDRAGVHERTAWAAIDGKPLLEALDQLADLADGVEYDFRPRIDEADWIRFDLITGTDVDRVIVGTARPLWNLGGTNPDIRGYQRTPDAGLPITDAVLAGGKDDDKVLLVSASDHSWIDDGYPRAEVWDTSHSTVSETATLASWAAGALGSVPDTISFDVRASAAQGVRHGDRGILAAAGHWDLPDGDYSGRVLSINRTSEKSDWVHVELV